MPERTNRRAMGAFGRARSEGSREVEALFLEVAEALEARLFLPFALGIS